MTFREDRTAWLNERLEEIDDAILALEAEYHGRPGGNELLERMEALEIRRQTLVTRKRGLK